MPNARTVEVNIEMYEVSEIVFVTSSLILYPMKKFSEIGTIR